MGNITNEDSICEWCKMKKINILPDDKRIFLFFISMGVIFILPLIIANSYYWDDYRRVLSGDYGWEEDGRPLADLFIFLLTQSITNLDIAPLPLLLSVVVLAIAAVIITKNLFPRETVVQKCILATPILVNPLFLNNLTFRFECWIMSLAQLFAVCAALLYRNFGWKGKVCRVFFLIILLATYQASLNFYIALCFLVLVLNIMRVGYIKKYFFDFLGDLCLILLSFFVYKISVTPFIHFGQYAATHNSLVKINRSAAEIVLKNIMKLMKSEWRQPVLSIVTCVGCACVVVFSPFNEKFQKIKNSRVLVILAIIIFVFLAPGLCIFLSNPVFNARIMLGFPVFLIFLFYLSMNSAWKKIGFSLILLNFISAFSTCYAYGNILRRQDEYREVLVTDIVNHLLDKGYHLHNKIIILGSEPIAPANLPADKMHLTLHTLIPRVLGNNWVWGYYALARQGISLDFPTENEIAKAENQIATLQPVYSNFRFRLYKNSSEFIVFVE